MTDGYVVKPVTTISHYTLVLPTSEVSSLYNNICLVLRELGVDMALDRKKLNIPALYALYDALYKEGIS